MALTPVDRDLLQRCLKKQPGAWNDFVDRYLSLLYHVIGYTAHLRSSKVNAEDVEDIAAEILLQIVADDYKVLKQFRGNATLATYLTVIARRICVHELTRRQSVRDAIRKGDAKVEDVPDSAEGTVAELKSLERLDEVDRLLRKLSGREREIVRLFYLEGRTYEEISTETGVPVNTIGAALTRAREKLRKYRKSRTDIAALTPAQVRASRKPEKKAEIKTGEAK
ncbi:RNA polymerase sigma factor [Limnoglobus roseus]|uniref:Sigma-70 family RNA polymerase sigma factor n=1 Tax=Limnoglobus roseus TaxID=2598579 RepID=A0A5C1AC39_9BACT|nr:sigma-70 family RNA polymerase sigma factor [Limnoglobus roseus]QEL16145.1 sigma-70 family RNA polymerase sigma factor [Limnoglobus roseus]